MDAIAEVASRKGVRAWVQFETRTIEDKARTAQEGKFVGVDVDYVIITPAYGKDDVHKKVKTWMQDLELQVASERIPQEDLNFYLAKYQAWKKGQEMPLEGSPIKGWGVISPAQQKLLISVGILTVEDLSKVNDEGIRRIGMGGVELKRKANAWLAQLQDKGPLTTKMAAIEAENDTLKVQVQTLMGQVEKLMAQPAAQPAVPVSMGITASDLIDEDPKPTRKR